jgi:hypothetical protein
MKQLIKRIPGIRNLVALIFPKEKFTNSEEYWEKRYKLGGNSGAGSYSNLAEFKGEIINDFVIEHKINSTIELGCGDGNQLEYFKFDSYIGFDVSETVIEKCKNKFKEDPTKKFLHTSSISDQKADMAMSLDVIYHLIEDSVYDKYMNHLFNFSNKYVVIYAYDCDEFDNYAPHVKPRKFTNWVKSNREDFTLIKHIPNKFPYQKNNPETTSFADFYIYEKK